MGKKFKGKTCVYCGTRNSSDSGDHVFSREFFLPDRRNNLPQVPACTKCNREKSVLEHYLTAVLPFGAKHTDAAINLEKMVPPRLAKNRKLHRHLAQERKEIWAKENGLFLPSIKIPFDSKKLDGLFSFIVKGLMWYHWGIILTPNTFVRSGYIKNIAENLFQDLFNKNASKRVRRDLGDGTIIYEGAQGVDSPYLSLWKFLVYGGVKVGDSQSAPLETPTLIWGLTGRSINIPKIWDA